MTLDFEAKCRIKYTIFFEEKLKFLKKKRALREDDLERQKNDKEVPPGESTPAPKELEKKPKEIQKNGKLKEPPIALRSILANTKDIETKLNILNIVKEMDYKMAELGYPEVAFMVVRVIPAFDENSKDVVTIRVSLFGYKEMSEDRILEIIQVVYEGVSPKLKEYEIKISDEEYFLPFAFNGEDGGFVNVPVDLSKIRGDSWDFGLKVIETEKNFEEERARNEEKKINALIKSTHKKFVACYNKVPCEGLLQWSAKQTNMAIHYYNEGGLVSYAFFLEFDDIFGVCLGIQEKAAVSASAGIKTPDDAIHKWLGELPNDFDFKTMPDEMLLLANIFNENGMSKENLLEKEKVIFGRYKRKSIDAESIETTVRTSLYSAIGKVFNKSMRDPNKQKEIKAAIDPSNFEKESGFYPFFKKDKQESKK